MIYNIHVFVSLVYIIYLVLRDAAGDLSVFLVMTQPTWLSNGGSAEYLVFAFTGS